MKMAETLGRRNDLAKIHIAKKTLGLSEGDYRTLLGRTAGVGSAADLDADGRRRVLQQLRRLGFTARAIKPTVTDGQRRYIRWLWLDLHEGGIIRDPGIDAMNHYIRRMTGIDSVYRLDRQQAITVIETLKRWQARVHRTAVKQSVK